LVWSMQFERNMLLQVFLRRATSRMRRRTCS
jgi:hypothetical protein